MASVIPHGPAALVIAHPGHELCALKWVELARPRVFILTDGSGSRGGSRLHRTTDILARAGARPGALYGRHSDARLYEAILARRHDLFRDAAEELADALVRDRIEYVVGDAAEGYNPVHDVCRILIDTAVRLAGRARGRPVANYDFSLTGRLAASRENAPAGSIWLRLEEADFERKLALLRSYPELAIEVGAALDGAEVESLKSHPQVAAEVSAMLAGVGRETLKVECLRPVAEARAAHDGPPRTRPFYELYGEMQVAAGRYERAILYGEHVRPLAEALALD